MNSLIYPMAFLDAAFWTNQLLNHAQEGNLAEVRKCIVNGALINYSDKAHSRIPYWEHERHGTALFGTALNYACKEGHADIVKFLLQNGARADACDRDNPLCLASRHGHVECMRHLLEMKCGKVDINGAFHQACQYGHMDAVRLLVEQGKVNVDILAIGTKEAPLTESIRWGRSAIAQYLVDNGANVNGVPGGRSKPLHVAASHGDLEVLHHLLHNGADANFLDDFGTSALFLACQYGYLECAKVLIESGKTMVNQKRYYESQSTPLHAAVGCCSRPAWRGNKADVAALVQCLVDNGADVDSLDSYGKSALYIACEDNHLDCVKILIQSSKALINRAEKYTLCQFTPLHIAAMHGYSTITQYLVDSGADVNILDGRWNNALHHACKDNHVEDARILIGSGKIADVNFQAFQVVSALHETCIWGYEAIARHLIEQGKANVDLQWVGDEKVHLVYDLGWKPPFGSVAGWTPLQFCAAMSGNAEIARFLVNAGANINASSRERQDTSLTLACETGNYDVAKVLLQSGKADLNHQNSEGWTALHLACKPCKWVSNEDRKDLVKVMVDIDGIDLNLRDKKGRTASDYAKRSKQRASLVDIIDESRHKFLQRRWALVHFLVHQNWFDRSQQAITMGTRKRRITAI